MTASRRISNINSTGFYSHVPTDEGDRAALPTRPETRFHSSLVAIAQQKLVSRSTSFHPPQSSHVAVERGGCFKPYPRAILVPLILMQICLLSPSAVLLVLTIYYRIDAGKSLFETPETLTTVFYVDLSATILTNISSVSSTLAPFLIAMNMEIWSLYVAKALIKASREDPETCHPLPTPVQFSILANMRAGRCDQIWKYITYHRQNARTRPLILRQTVVILILSLCACFLAFLGDQFFHVWSESVNLYQYSVPENYSSFGKGLTPECISLNRADNYGLPCTRYGSLQDIEIAKRENELSYLSANTSRLNQIRFETAADLPHGDLAVLYPAPVALPPNIDYRARTLGVSTQCRFMTPTCKVKHISVFLTQFNCSDTFFGVLGKPANITANMTDKAQDPDVPGLAWKISPSLEYMFYSDRELRVPYNVMGLNTSTGYNNPNLPILPNSALVNPVFLAVAGRISRFDVAADSTIASKSASDLLLPTYYGDILEFFLNCSYATYDVEYTMVNGTALPSLTFTPTPNGSVAEEWHGRQQYVSFNGDPSSGLTQSANIAAKQETPQDFARTWANLYSTRILAVIGAYTDPRRNLDEQVRHTLLVTRIVPWTLYFLLLANLAYALLGLMTGVIAWAVSTKDVLRVAENMDLNKQIAEKYGGAEMGESGRDGNGVYVAKAMTEDPADSRLRVGVVGNNFESLYYAI